MISRNHARALFLESTAAMFESGQPLMARVLGDDNGEAESWTRYPSNDVVNGPLGSRWFYHCHAPEERGPAEHGHFHLFVDKAVLPGSAEPLMRVPESHDAEVVHLAALSINWDGLPTGWFTTNRWVTEECMYAVGDVVPLIDKVDFRGPNGDPLVNNWLTALFALQRDEITEIMAARDERIIAHGIRAEDRGTEVLSSVPIDLGLLFD